MKVAVTADLHVRNVHEHPERYHALQNILTRMKANGIEHLVFVWNLLDASPNSFAEYESPGKFETNQLVLHCSIVAYNILRMIGQIANNGDHMPMRKRANRRRIRTVIQNLIYLAARLVSHARKHKLSFGKWSPWFPAYERVYQQLLC